MILQLLLALLSFILSWIGLFVFLLGLVFFLAITVVPLLTGVGKRLAHIHLWLAMWLVKRGAIVVSEHNDILFKRMEFDDIGVEKISFTDETKEFEDADASLHTWMGFPFALADEVHGLLFDPRHAAVGTREDAAEERNEMSFRATDSEWEMYEFYGWIRGVFEFPKDTYEMVDLSKVRALATGTERAEYPARVKTMYKNSRLPYRSGRPSLRVLMPIVALLGTFFGLWVLARQGDTGGGSTSTVGYGSIFLGILSAKGANVDWKRAVKVFLVALPLPLIFLLLVLMSPILAIVVLVVFTMGFLFLPFITLIARASTILSGGLAKFYLKLGLLAYRKPVFTWTPAKYELREFDDLGDVANVKWYSLAGSLVGFSFEPGEDSWGAEVMDRRELDLRKEAATDGGAKTNIPAGYVRYPDMQRAVYGGFVPSRLKDRSYYLNTGIALSRFTNHAVGNKSLRKLLQAKDEHGEGGMLDDKSLMYMTVGCGLFGTILGVLIFFVL